MSRDLSRAVLASEPVFRAVAIALAGLLALVLLRLQFCGDVSLPPKPPRPEAPTVTMRQVSKALEADPRVYQGYLDEDAKSFAVTPAPTAADMGRQFAYQKDTDTHVLNPDKDDSVTVLGLTLTASLRRAKGLPHKLMVLTVENPGDQFLAYRVVTRPTSGTRVCHNKKELGHNAMALMPGQQIERSECTYRRGWKLEVRSVEVVALPALSYHYVSRLPPDALGLDTRTSAGHNPPLGKLCQMALPAKIRADLDAGRTTWRDLIDFFARHRCDNYRFPHGYRAFSRDGEQPLPIVPDS